MKDEIMVYVKKKKLFLYVAEGTGDNLWQEDMDEGYVDYLYIEVYKMDGTEMFEVDGGELLLKEYVKDRYADDDGTRMIQDAAKFIWDMEIRYDDYVIIDN